MIEEKFDIGFNNGEIKSEFQKIVQNMDHQFIAKLKMLRNDLKNIGKYLIGISRSPWINMDFSIGTETDYQRRLAEKYENEKKGIEEALYGGLI